MIKTYKTAEDKEKSKYDKSIIPEFITVVECKAYKEKIHVNILEELHIRILYGNFVRGIVVSKNGFSENAIKFATIYNIGLYIVNENDAVETIVRRKEKSERYC